MRKRKLYLSEFIQRNYNKYDDKVDIVKEDKHTVFNSLKVIENYEDLYNSEIDKWTYSKTLQAYIIILK